MLSDTPQEKLSSRSIKAALWSLVGKGGSNAIRLLSNLVLTRLLFPETFGLMGTAVSLMLMVQLFTDTGTRISIIQNPRGSEPVFLNTAWTIGIIRGAGLSLVMLGIAWPLAAFYGKPGLGGIMTLLALTPLISGFENPALSLLIRQMKGHRQIIYDLLPQAGALICTATLAWFYRSVWALAIGAVLSGIMRLATSYLAQPYRPRLAWDTESGHELVHFGKYVLLNTMVCWSANNLDGFFVGKVLGMDILGVYSIGMNLGITVELLFMQMLGNSYFPALSRIAHDRPRVVRAFMRSGTLLVALAVPILLLLALFSEQVIAILYDQRYAGAGVVLFWCSVKGLSRIISALCGPTLLAMGHPRSETISMGVALTTLSVALPVGIHFFALKGTLIAVLLTAVAGMLAQCWFLIRGEGFPVRALAVPLAQMAVIAVVTFAAHTLLRPLLDARKWQALPFMAIILTISAGISYLCWRLAQRAVPPSS